MAPFHVKSDMRSIATGTVLQLCRYLFLGKAAVYFCSGIILSNALLDDFLGEFGAIWVVYQTLAVLLFLLDQLTIGTLEVGLAECPETITEFRLKSFLSLDRQLYKRE